VLGGKFVTAELWDKLGVNWGDVHTSQNADMFTGVHPYDETEYAKMQAWLDRVYRDFTGKVAGGREMEIDQVLEIAKGRIWSGEDALELGLVDGLGGWHEALAATREVLELEPDAALRVRRIPAERSPLELLLEGRPDHRRAAREALSRLLETVQPAARALGTAFGDAEPGVRVPGDLVPVR
jgi:protease-4